VLWKDPTTCNNFSVEFRDNLLQKIQQESMELDSNDDTILSMDVDKEYLYLGTQTGRIFIFSLSTLLSTGDVSTSLVNVVVGFTSKEPGVSALCAAGQGSLGTTNSSSSSRRPATKGLIAGSVMGEIKQWELIPTGNERVEYWPRMASQKLPGKAHIFGTGVGGDVEVSFSSNGSNDSSTIRSLLCVQQVILAATDTTLKFWDPITGKPLYDMNGLDFAVGRTGGGLELPRPSLVVAKDSVLVTNGMDQYVCVHDFAMDRVTSENAQEMIERDDAE
jgi:hypothetical protein